VLQALEELGPALPTGIFGNDQVHRQLARLFSRPGRTNDFRRLRSRLTLVATDLDTGEAAPFGRPGWDHVPISRAVQASAALPGLFPPVRIDGHDYVDGALKKTLHATVALDEGVDLLLCLNPLVPFDASAAPARIPRIADGGLPAVLSQTVRTMIHSRMELRMKAYARAYPGTDIVLLEPDQRDPQLFLANTFGYRRRRELAEHAYQQTRALLRTRRHQLAPVLARHGVTLRDDVLRERRQLVTGGQPPTRIGRAIATLQAAMDDLALHVQATAAGA
jgi:predicted acylesterase/phospholipase RssA